MDGVDSEIMEAVLDLAAAVGARVNTEDVVIEEREDRMLARLPKGLLAWLPTSAAGLARLESERRVLGLVARHCTFKAPRVLHVSELGGDVRSMVAGQVDPLAMARRLSDTADLARAIGAQLGEILADQHRNVPRSTIRPWLRDRVAWPEPLDWIAPRLARVAGQSPLTQEMMGEMTDALDRYFSTPVPESRRVLVHGDFGLHNMVFSEDGGTVEGVFDYDGAAWDDYHHDFRYLEFERGNTSLLDAAAASYEAATGRSIDRGRVDLLNAVSAICFLAHRDGIAPEVVWCGRTLAEDIRWVTDALSRLR